MTNIFIFLCLIFSLPAVLSVEKCECGKNQARHSYGRYGIVPVRKFLRNSMDDSCLKEWVPEVHLFICLRQLFGLEAKNGTIPPNELPYGNVRMSINSWNITFSSENITLLKAQYNSPCAYIDTKKCYTLQEEMLIMHHNMIHRLERESNDNDTTTVATVTNVVTSVTSNIRVTSLLDNEQGPATNPRNGVFLYGYHFAPTKNRIIYYFVVLDNKKIETKCSCTSWWYKHDIFTIRKLNCLINSDGCFVKYQDTEIRVEYDEASSHCAHDHVFVRSRYPKWSSAREKNQKEQYILCINGTIMEEDRLTFSDNSLKRLNCEGWRMIDTYEQCDGLSEINKCKISDTKNDNGKLVSTVKNLDNGFISITSHGNLKKLECNQECEVIIDPDIETQIMCMDGKRKVFYPNKVNNDCPLLDYYYTGYLSVFICRATYHPNTFWFLLLFLIIGKKLTGTIYFLIDLFCYMIFKLCQSMKIKLKVNPSFCEHCDEPVSYDELKVRHRNCIDDICPYCKSKCKTIKKHAPDCKSKKMVIASVELPLNEKVCMSDYFGNFSVRKHWEHPITFISTALICVILFCVVITPVQGKKPTMTREIRPEWDETDKSSDGCENNCFHNGFSCVCSDTYAGTRIRRKRNIPENHKINAVKKLGFIDLESNFKPSLNKRIIDLSFNIRSTSKGKNIVSGSSNVIMELEPSTSIMWKITNEDSLGSARVILGIREILQKYKTKFNFWITDRRVITGSDNSCTGDCHPKCGCNSKTCKIFKKEHIRSWTCNPTWCWGINTGCSCCFTKAEIINPKYLIAEFEVELEETIIDICISRNSNEFKCKYSSHGDTFENEGIGIKFSKPYNINKFVHKKIYIVFKVDGKKFDITHPNNIIFDEEVCTISNCRHGEVGDYRFTNISTMLYEGGNKYTEDGVEMIWGSIHQTMDCESFHWPTCNVEGVVEHNSEMFDYLIENSKHLKDEFFIKSSTVNLNKDMTPSLILTLTPKKDAGMTQVFLTAKGVELDTKKVEYKIGTFKISKCNGCYNCHSGIHCIVHLSHPMKQNIMVHFYSSNRIIKVDSQSYLIRQSVDETFNITVFSSIWLDSIELCVEEVKICKSTKEIQLYKIGNRPITDQKIMSIQEADNGTLSFSYTGQYLGNFFSNMWQFILQSLTSPFMYLLFILGICILSLPPLFRYIRGTSNADKPKVNYSKIE